jgi:hypothetical protein
MLAPADLLFEDVTDLEVRFDCRGIAMGPLSIGEIRREATEGGLYRRTIILNFPKGEIVFLASGFVQELRAAPVESARQSLTWDERRRLGRTERMP